MNVFSYIKRHGSDGIQALAVEAENLTDKKHYKLLNEGWEHVLDNVYPSLVYAYEVMERGIIDDKNEEIFAYKEYCRCCGWYMPVTKVVGTRWDDGKQKQIIFNGRACDQCIQDFVSVKFRGANISPMEAENILIRETFAIRSSD